MNKKFDADWADTMTGILLPIVAQHCSDDLEEKEEAELRRIFVHNLRNWVRDIREDNTKAILAVMQRVENEVQIVGVRGAFNLVREELKNTDH